MHDRAYRKLSTDVLSCFAPEFRLQSHRHASIIEASACLQSYHCECEAYVTVLMIPDGYLVRVTSDQVYRVFTD